MRNDVRRSLLTHACRALLVGGALALSTGVAMAQPYSQGRYQPNNDRVEGRFVDVSVLAGGQNQALTVYRHGGRAYVAGASGEPYRLLLTNRSSERIMAVVSVDGINVLDGKTAAYNQMGYVLEPYQTATIDGWRKSYDHVARFEFANLPNSYAGQTGRPGQVGVIGVAVFQERFVRPRPGARGQGRVAMEDSASVQSARGLGTGHGPSEWSPVDPTTFVRRSTSPVETIRIDYDRWNTLVRKGIARPEQGRRGEPDPFPAQNGFVPDPPRYRERW